MAPNGRSSAVTASLPASDPHITYRHANGRRPSYGHPSGQQSSNGRLPHRHKLPDVDVALQFSPVSSIVPFSTDIVPIPDAQIPGFQSTFADPLDQHAARQQLAQVNQGLLGDSGQSDAALRTEADLKRFIKPDDITDFKFRKPAKFRTDQQHQAHGKSRDAPSTTNLSPLAISMLKHVNIESRYPTPTSPHKQPKTTQKHSSVTSRRIPSPSHDQPGQEPQVKVSQKSISSNNPPKQSTPPPYHAQSATKAPVSIQQPSLATPSTPRTFHAHTLYAPNHTIITNGMPAPSPTSARQVAKAVQIPAPSPIPTTHRYNASPPQTAAPRYASNDPQASPSQKPGPQPMVVIPPSSAEARKSDFVTVDVSSQQGISRKRKRALGGESAITVLETRDQKAAADGVLSQLKDLVEEIFEADNQSQSNPQLLVPVRLDDREVNAITNATQMKLELALQKIISYGRLREIPVEDLQRLQGLCEGAIASIEHQEISYSSEWASDDFEEWTQRLDDIDLALRSARTVLRIMTGGREEKQLYSEELLLTILRMVQKVADSCIIPVVETRTSSSAEAFLHLSEHKKTLSQVSHGVTKVMGLFVKLLIREDMSETVITPVEFFAVRLLFVENASSEKESILGTQRYEGLRRTAMDVIATVFSRYSAQRTFLFDEILTSLQRLPTSRQAARQFRLSNGRAIQLVTALIIQLVQTSAAVTKKPRIKQVKTSMPIDKGDSQDSSPSAQSELEPDSDESEGSDESEDKSSETIRRLRKDATALCDSAAKSAQHAVGYLMQRAQTASKTGDQPHRQLLDIFVEDLLLVLGLPEWPGAELLLRAVCARASHTFENIKSLAPAKNMALELIGTMGSAISDLVANTRLVVKGLENQDAEYSGYLRQMFDDYSDGSIETSELLAWDGPYHAVVEHLESINSDDLQIRSAQAYYLAQWAKAICTSSSKPSIQNDKLAGSVRTLLSAGEWISPDTMGEITSSQCQVAYALTILNMDFCKRFDYMLRILLDSVTSEQTTVRSRGLKSVTQMLEKDPSILDRARNVKNIILRCASDTSPMVRDAALTLIGKCITLKSALEAEFLNHVLHLSNDPAIGVRKRSMKLLKDIYLRNSSKDVKAAICDSLLQRARDPDTGVADLARQMFEEIWITPFLLKDEASDHGAQIEMNLRTQVLLIIRTVARSANTPAILICLLKDILSNNSKSAASNFRICKRFVMSTFELMIDATEGSNTPDQGQVLETLTIFAQANSRLFVSDQLKTLQPYVSSINSLNDLNIFRPVVVIFRCVLPVLSSIEHGLLESIQTALLRSVSRLSKNELNEVANCLWTINGALQKPEPLIKLVASVLKGLRGLESVDFNDADSKDNLLRVRKYILLAGYFGKHCDFENHATTFQSLLPGFKGGSVAGFIVQALQPYASPSQPLALRAVAFDGLGLICQSWPFQFTQPVLSKAFAAILQKGDQVLQEIVLSNFRDFFTKAEDQAAPKPEDNSNADALPIAKLGGSLTANERDSASALITQHFLKDILSIALASQDDSALTATEVIASINRQGLAHPKESGPALVALGTSTYPAIAKVASEQHRMLHSQHEGMFEREYMRALQEAFRYQKDVVQNVSGFTAQPLAAKLNGTWEIIKTSKAKYQKKFLSSYCSKIDFDATKLDTLERFFTTLQFSRFLTESLALFEFSRLDELLHTIACVEKIVAASGSTIAHSISTEIFHITVETEEQDVTAGAQQQDAGTERLVPPLSQNPMPGSQKSVDPERLRLLTMAAIILSSLWEARTYLRRLHGQSAMQQRRENGKGKPPTKDLSKAPTRVQGISGEKLMVTIADKVASLGSPEAMMKQCEEFVELLSVDSEVKVNAESEESLGEGGRPETPGLDDDEERDTPMSGASRGVKRKSSVSASGTPSKKRGRPPLGRRKSSRKSVGSVESDEEWK